MTPPQADLQNALGHRFANAALLERALTHRSFGAAHNERLEFLGDAVLSASMSTLLFNAYPDAAEGELSRWRSALVRQDPLHRVAVGLGLPNLLRLGEGESRSGGATRPSILADTLEALIGAVYLDGGFAASHAVVERLFGPQLAEARAGAGAKDAKTSLQEWLQAAQRPLPLYRVQALSGQAHAQQFEVVCVVSPKPGRGKSPAATVETVGQGATRRSAEKAAAQAMLIKLGVA